MKKTLLVVRHEMLTVIGSKAFLFLACVIPLLGVLIFLGVSLLKGGEAELPAGLAGPGDAPELQVEGYVDLAGLVKSIPADIPEGNLLAYPDETSARQALNEGTITAYYVIAADYVERGDLIYVNPSYGWASSSRGQSWVMARTLFANLLESDPERIARASQPMDLQVVPLAPDRVRRDEDGPLAFYVPYATMMILYFTIIMSASLLLNSVSSEKKSRVLEVLLLSVSPQQMLTGKIVGLGVLGLVQAAIWAGTGYALLRVGGRTSQLAPGLALPPSILAWGIVFFLLGFAVYASLMAALGALVPSLQEASQSFIVVIWPLLVPLFFFVALIEKPHGAIAVGFSLFPLTAPVAMMTRLAASEVPWWQLLLAAVLLLGTAVCVIRAVSRMFHAQNLLSGQPFSARRYIQALLGRA
jgi:ABC-2 type transport system permease protein